MSEVSSERPSELLAGFGDSAEKAVNALILARGRSFGRRQKRTRRKLLQALPRRTRRTVLIDRRAHVFRRRKVFFPRRRSSVRTVLTTQTQSLLSERRITAKYGNTAYREITPLRFSDSRRRRLFTRRKPFLLRHVLQL